jgi:hypothetical protein
MNKKILIVLWLLFTIGVSSCSKEENVSSHIIVQQSKTKENSFKDMVHVLLNNGHEEATDELIYSELEQTLVSGFDECKVFNAGLDNYIAVVLYRDELIFSRAQGECNKVLTPIYDDDDKTTLIGYNCSGEGSDCFVECYVIGTGFVKCTIFICSQ